MLLSKEELAQVKEIISLPFASSLVACDRVLNDIKFRKGYFINVVRSKFEVLDNLDETFIYTTGAAINNNLGLIKSYDFMNVLLNSFYEIVAIQYVMDYNLSASLLINLTTSNQKAILKIYNTGEFKIYKDGARKVYKRPAVFNDIDLRQYLKQFLIYGVYLNDVITNESTGSSQLYSGAEALLTTDNEQLFTVDSANE